jgi:hypothetical protein
MQSRTLVVLAVVLGVVLFSAVAQAAQPFDFTSCRSGTVDVLAKTEDMYVRSAVWNGIDQSHHENKLFDNWTHRCMAISADIAGKKLRNGYCKYMDPDGDFVVLDWPAAPGKPGTWKFLQGTGKWKGITGGGDYKVTKWGKPIEKGTFQFCIHVTGTLELPK